MAPVLQLFGQSFIHYELSTPLRNIRSFMDKSQLAGSTAQLLNGVALITNAGCSCFVWGTCQSVRMYHDM